MKNIKLLIAGMAIVLLVFSCTGDKKAQLSKLKSKQATLDEKIRSLEAEIRLEQKDTLDVAKFKFVGITEASESPFDHYIRVQGAVDGDKNAGVFAEAPGTIIAKYADVGQKVVRGQVLAQIDDGQFRNQMQSLETQYKLASDLYEKQKRLWDQKIGSEVQFLQAKTNKESLERQISALNDQIDKFKIKSPIDGTIEECNIKLGGVVSPDPRLAAYRVVAFRNLKITAQVSEAYSSKVQVGDSLVVFFPDIQKTVKTKVDFVSQYINPENRTFTIETRIGNGVPDLKANMLAVVQINDYHSDSSILLPMNVVQTDLSGSYVYVVRSKDEYSAAYKQPIVIGNSYNGVAEIKEGLNVGDKVVSTGYQELINGEYVRFN
jgi:membrane fusion protein (multidrug efflux system)